MRSFPGSDTSSKLETRSVGSLTGAMMALLTISRRSCFSLSLSATGTRRGRVQQDLRHCQSRCGTGLTIFLILGKHMHICAVCQLDQSKASSLLCIKFVYTRGLRRVIKRPNGVHIHPLDRTDAKICLADQLWLIVFTAHHFEVQIVFTTISVNLMCCGRHYFNYLPTIHSQCV